MFTKRLALLLGILITAMLITGCNSNPTPTPAPTPTASTTTITAKPEAANVEVNADKTITTTAMSGELLLYFYNSMWEYLEYGHTAQYFHPEGAPHVVFNSGGQNNVFKRFTLTPPQYRGLRKALEDNPAPEAKYYVMWVNDEAGQEMLMTVSMITDTEGIIWTRSMEQGPRPLTALERWTVNYLSYRQMKFDLDDLLDVPPSEADAPYMLFSPLEGYARAEAFKAHATNPSNHVFVQSPHSTDRNYRWADSKGNELLPVTGINGGWKNLVQRPDNGEVTLQVSTYDNPNLFTDHVTFNTTPGYLVCLDQEAELCGAGKLEWMGREPVFSDWMANQTADVGESTLLGELTEYGHLMTHAVAPEHQAKLIVLMEDTRGRFFTALVTDTSNISGNFDFDFHGSLNSWVAQKAPYENGEIAWVNAWHFYDPEDPATAAWMDSAKELSGWRELKADFRQEIQAE